MSEQHQELVPALAGRMAPPSDRAAGSARVGDDREVRALMQRARAGDGEALRGLAERMAPRVRHVARALMGRSLDADDAAVHTLIELLRSYPQFAGDAPFDRSVDRVAALSVLRFARAVRKRTASGRSESKAEAGDQRAARTFEQYLRVLSDTSREVLLLRHALGFRVVDLPDALRCSTRSAKDRLLAARRELRGLVRRGGQEQPGAGSQRWCALRDLEAVDEQLSEAEQNEVAELEASEPEIWAYVAQVRALELYFAAHSEPPREEDRALVEAALPAVQITVRQVLGRPLDSEAEFDRSLDGEGDGFAQLIAVAGCVALALGCIVALLVREPGRSRAASRGGTAPSAGRLEESMAPSFQPTVEALASMHTAQRGGRLRRAGALLSPGAALGEGDVVESAERAACITVGELDALCLASNSVVRISSLSRRQPRVELLRGRVVISGGEEANATRLELQAAAWLVADASGGVVAVERGGDLATVRVRALRGHSRLTFGEHAHMLAPAFAAAWHVGQPMPNVTALPQLVAQRDWELLATLGKPSLLPAGMSIGRAGIASQLDESSPQPGAERPTPASGLATPATPTVRAESSVTVAPTGAAVTGAASSSAAPTGAAAATGALAGTHRAAPSSTLVGSPKPTVAATALAELEAPSVPAPLSERAKQAAAAVDDILLERGGEDTGEVVVPRE